MVSWYKNCTSFKEKKKLSRLPLDEEHFVLHLSTLVVSMFFMSFGVDIVLVNKVIFFKRFTTLAHVQDMSLHTKILWDVSSPSQRLARVSQFLR